MTAALPCSSRHGKFCSSSHSILVWDYRDERRRQETIRDEITGGYDGDEQHYKATQGNLIDFKKWLIANRKSGVICPDF